MYSAVVFDFDYTLGDSTNGIVLSINYALSKLGHGERETEAIRKTVGFSLKDTFAMLTGKEDEIEAQAFSKCFKEKADVDFAGVLTGTTKKEDFLEYNNILIGKDVNDVCRSML